jgi:hypothetical protein
MSIEYGTILRIRFKTKEEELFFVNRVNEEGFELLTIDGDLQQLSFEDSDILEVSVVYIPPKSDYASIRNLYVGNWVQVIFMDKPLYGKIIKTGSTLEIESNGVMYYIPVRYGLPKDITHIDISRQPIEKKTKSILETVKELSESVKEVYEEGEEQKQELEESEDIYDVEDESDELFYTMEQKKNDLTNALLETLDKQSQSALKKVYQEVQRFQELFEKYTTFEKNILLKRLPERLHQDSFAKNENEFFSPVTNHIKVKHNFTENEKRMLGSVPDYYFKYDEPASTYEMYIPDSKKQQPYKQIPYQEFISKEAKVVQSYDIRKNHTEHDFYPTQNREVYLLNELAKYKVNETFVTDSFVVQPQSLSRYTRKRGTILSKVQQSNVPYFDLFFRKSPDDMQVVHVNEEYKAECVDSDRMTWFKNECPTFQNYIEKIVPSFQTFMNCYIEKDFLNLYQALYELEILHIDEMNATVYNEVVDRMRTNIAKFIEEREKEKKQALRKKAELFTRENHDFYQILRKEYGLGPRNEKTYYTTSELLKEGMFDKFHFYIIQYLRKHAPLQQVVSDEEMSRLVDEIKNAFGKESEERVHKVYENEQQRESDNYKFVLQDIPRGTKFISADEELYSKLLLKNSSLTIDEVKIKLNRIRDLGEKEIPNQFEKSMIPFIQEFLLKNRIMKGQVAFVRESGKKYRWSGDKWTDLTEDIQAKKIYKIKDFKYNEDSFQKKVQEMIHAFESEKLRSQAIQKMKLEDESHKLSLEKSKLMWLKENMKYHTEKYQYYELELQKELFDVKQSPYLSLRNRILQEMILENKYKAIQLFVQQYTKTGEDVHWFYCLETGVKLLPTFFMELADSFLKSNTYPQTLQLICDRQGELSDNHDFYVDKYSGFPIKQIQFDEDEDFNDQGFRDIFHSVVEKENETTEVDTQNPVRNALKTFLNLMGLVPQEDVLEDIFTNVEKSFLLASGDKKKTREQNQIYIYSILSHSLIYGQTLEGNVRLSKPFPDCPKSLKGFPLNTTSKKGLEFVCCIVAKMPKQNEPWNSMGSVKVEKLLEISELFIHKYVLTIQEVRERLSKKLEVQEKKEEFPVWNLFYPRLRPIQIVPELSSVPQDRIIGLSILLQQKIHTFVSTQTGILVNQAQEPYLINTCCQTNNDVYDYLVENAKLASTLKELYDVLKKENKMKQHAMTYHMYCPINTKNPPSNITNSFDEKTIYRSIIKIFLLDTDRGIPEKLKKYKEVIKPAEYKKNDLFERKFELLKHIPISEEKFVSILRDNASIFERRKGRVIEEENVGNQPIDIMIQEKKENDLYDFCIVSIEEKMKTMLSKARNREEKKVFKQCFQFYTLFREDKHNDFLPKGMEHKESMNRILYNKIKQLLHVFPEKIYNHATPPRKLPKHWKLDEIHMENIMKFTTYDSDISNFYENETWKMKYKEIDLMDYERWLKISCNITMKYTLYCYIYVSIFNDLVEKGLIDYVRTIVEIFLLEDKLALNFDKKQIDYISDMAKKSETEQKTEHLKQLTKDARKAQNAMKDLKLGEWGVGLDKSLFKYDKSKYGDVLEEATKIKEGMDIPDELYGTYGVDDGDNLEGFDGDEYYS